jgi:hypothetical protein
MIDKKMNNLRKMGGVVALLASTIAIADSASAFNLTIGNATAGTNFSTLASPGQSFINDPGDSTTLIFLDNWTFAFNTPAAASAAALRPLSILNGAGNAGSSVPGGTSPSGTVVTDFVGNADSAVRWDFSGVTLGADDVYTAILGGTGASNLRITPTNGPYPNGIGYNGANNTPFPTADTVFQAKFSDATPVPFDFEPTGGLAVLGGGWLLRRHLQKKKSTKV